MIFPFMTNDLPLSTLCLSAIVLTLKYCNCLYSVPLLFLILFILYSFQGLPVMCIIVILYSMSIDMLNLLACLCFFIIIFLSSFDSNTFLLYGSIISLFLIVLVCLRPINYQVLSQPNL